MIPKWLARSRKGIFLVGALFFKEKSLTFTVTFISADHRPTLKGPLFTETKTTEGKAGQRKLSTKDPPFHFLLFKIIPTKPDDTKGSPSLFFDAMRQFF